MIVKITLFLIFAVVVVAIAYYLNRKKASHQLQSQPSKLENTQKQTNNPKILETPKVDEPPKPVASIAQTVETPVIDQVTELTVLETEIDSDLLEQSILQRHHLSHIRQMLIATMFPQPTDSALSRHYDEMIDAKAEDCLADETKMAKLTADYEALEDKQNSEFCFEEQSILQRHHLSHIRQMLIATIFPQPTDSALSRHYDEMIDAKAEDCLADETKMAKLTADYEALEDKQNSEFCFEEQSILQRHHLSHIRQMLIATMFPQPTDSALSRHYDEMIDAKAEDCLADETKMAKLTADYEALQNA